MMDTICIQMLRFQKYKQIVVHGQGVIVDGQYIETGNILNKHTLQAFTPYSETLTSGDDVLTINYTLDNYIKVYGVFDGKAVAYEGYINADDDIKIEMNAGSLNVKTIKFNDMELKDGEILKEKICYRKDSLAGYQWDTFPYIYDSDNIKFYRNEGRKISDHNDDEYFYVDTYGNVVWADELSELRYKEIAFVDITKLSAAGDEAPLIIYYQCLTDPHRFFHYNDVGDFEEILPDPSLYSIYNRLNSTYGSTLHKDFSARNYCVRTKAMTAWVNQTLGSKSWKSSVLEAK